MSKIKPLEGQMSLIPGEPPVMYCRGCGKPLRGERSRKRGFGPLCWALHQGRLLVRLYCRGCGKRLAADEAGCTICGAGFEGPLRVRRVFVKEKSKKGGGVVRVR